MDCVTKGVEEGFDSIKDRYDISDDVLNDMKALVLESCKKHVSKAKMSETKNSSGASSKTRKRNGYNMFIKSRFKESKENTTEGVDVPNSQTLMTEFSKAWKDLSDEDRQKYLDMATEYNQAHGTDTSVEKVKPSGKPKRRITGYNVFYRDNREEIKANKEDDSVTLMQAVGKTWKALSDEERKEWNDRAEAEADATAEAAAVAADED